MAKTRRASYTPLPPSAGRRVRGQTSALAGALERVGDRWSLLVVQALDEGPRRFADLHESLPGIATNVLSERLRRLEAQQIVLAVPYSRRPLRFTYQLTETGRGLSGAARLLAQWDADNGPSDPRTPTHPACGTPLQARWYCPTCDQVGEPSEELTWI